MVCHGEQVLSKAFEEVLIKKRGTEGGAVEISIYSGKAAPKKREDNAG